MHEALLEAHNTVVRSQDHVSFLGDVTIKRGGRIDREWFIREMHKYNGHKRLFLGNHDHFPIRVYQDAGFEKIYATWRDNDGITYSHVPIHPLSLGSAWANVHGHLHANSEYDPAVYEVGGERIIKPYLNICLERMGYQPVHIDDIKAMLRNKIAMYKEKLNNGDNIGVSLIETNNV